MSVAYIHENINIFIFICLILFVLFYKIQHTFLYHSTLPVFKKYEIWKWIQKPKLVVHSFDETSKFYDTINTTTVNITDTELIKSDIEQHCVDLKNNFFSSNQILEYNYIPSISYITALHTKNSFLSSYTVNHKVISRIFSRQLHLCMYRKQLCSFEDHEIQFNDFICTDPVFRKKQHTQRLIYTHMANICNQSKANYNHKRQTTNKIFIAKYENTTLPLIPLVTYYSYAYNIVQLNSELKEYDLTPAQISRINEHNIQLYYQFLLFLKESKLFHLVLHESIYKVKHLIKQNILYIYALHYKQKVFALYIFHDTHTQFKNKNIIECISSARHSECDDKLFNDTFIYVLQQLKLHKYSILILECTSHNVSLQNHMNEHIRSLYSLSVSYNIVNYQQIPYYPIQCFFVL